MGKLVLVVFLLVLGSCVTDEVRGCRDADWYNTGFEDAVYGKKISHSVERQSSCKTLGFTFDDKKYRSGFRAGLKKFCCQDSGAEFGVQGQIYQYTCPKATEAQFLTGYWEGRRQFLHEELEDKKGLMKSIAFDIEEKKKRLTKLKREPTDDGEKKMLSLDVSKLRERKKTVADEISRLNQQLDGLEK